MQSSVTDAVSVPLQVDGVSKLFGQRPALNAVSLRVEPGQCFGLLGPNGAGKTTLIRSIVGRVRPESGSVRIFGELAGTQGARAAIGWVPQDLALYPRLSARENLEAFGQYHGLRGKALADQIRWCLDWAGLSDRDGNVVSTLSGGMKRRLNLAIGVIHRPRLILLDEPTVGVDPQSRNRIFDMVSELRQQGVAVIYTTHYMEEAERLCDCIAIIDHAQLIAQGTRDELITRCFGQHYTVEIRLMADAAPDAAVAGWVSGGGGTVTNNTARFDVAHPADLAGLVQSAETAGLGVADVVLHRPNLESVFLHLTGRELRA